VLPSGTQLIIYDHHHTEDVPRKYAATDANAPATYVLSSVGLLRKYTFLGDLPLTALPFTWRILGALLSKGNEQDESFDDKALIASPWVSYLRTRQAFRSHGSQYSWDRNLYMVLSRQVWFNDLRRVRREQT
jgi:N-acetylglucosaminylphosphatidylinositol deacetylase